MNEKPISSRIVFLSLVEKSFDSKLDEILLKTTRAIEDDIVNHINGDKSRDPHITKAEAKQALRQLIADNYTPNSEVEKQVREAELTFVARSADYYKQWESELTKGEQ